MGRVQAAATTRLPRLEQVAVQGGIEQGARLDVLLEAGFAFEDDQRAVIAA
jgi:hypothetical protein